MKNKKSLKSIFLNGVIAENPVFVSLLGMCPTLATTKTLEAAIGMSILVIFVLIGSNVIISLLRNIIPAEVKIPAYIVIIATFVTVVKLLCQAFIPELYSSLGVFISLIVVNCIILGRAESFASKNGPLESFMDAIGSGLGFMLALCVMGFFREIISTGGLSVGKYFTFLADKNGDARSFLPLADYAIPFFKQAAGGFLTLGFILAFLAWRKNVKEDKAALAQKKRIEELKAKKAAELAQKKALEAKTEVKEAA